MKLKCHHKRRVLVIPWSKKAPEGVLIDRTVVHREDGTHCDSDLLRIGDHIYPTLQVALSGIKGTPVRDDRLGHEYVEHVKRVQKSLTRV
jgi:hypothetical protein